MLHAVLLDLGLLLKSKIVSFTKPMFSYMSLVEKPAHNQSHKGGSTSAPNLALFQAPEIKSCCLAPPKKNKRQLQQY